MQNVILIVHLILAICLIASVLLQRSEGGALGIGGGGGGISSRPPTSPLARLTWVLATAFIATSITLAILAGGDPAGRSVLDELGAPDGGIILPDLPPAADDGAGAGSGTPPVTLPDLDPAPGGSGEADGPAPVAPPTAD